jgi:hypothetical protein
VTAARTGLGAAAIGALVAACGQSGEAIVCDAVGPVVVDIGGGTEQTGFVPMADGAPMALVLGPQGLYMVTPSLRVRGVYPGVAGRRRDPADPEIAIEAALDGAVIGASAVEHIGLVVTADGAEAAALYVPFSVDRSEYLEEVVTLHADVSDACGAHGEGQLEVRPTTSAAAWPP